MHAVQPHMYSGGDQTSENFWHFDLGRESLDAILDQPSWMSAVARNHKNDSRGSIIK